MSHSDLTTWTCDRCGRSVAIEKKAFPAGWQWVTAQAITAPDIPPVSRTWEVCGGCFSQTERLLMNQRNVEAA